MVLFSALPPGCQAEERSSPQILHGFCHLRLHIQPLLHTLGGRQLSVCSANCQHVLGCSARIASCLKRVLHAWESVAGNSGFWRAQLRLLDWDGVAERERERQRWYIRMYCYVSIYLYTFTDTHIHTCLRILLPHARTAVPKLHGAEVTCIQQGGA